jgi:hypothetical protein
MYFTALTLVVLTALSTALPTTISKRYPSGLNTIHPYRLYTYTTMEISPTTKYKVSRDFPSGREVSTLVTFKLELKPATPLPQTCFLRFSVGPKTLSSPGSKNKIAVFSSLEPAPEPVSDKDVLVSGNKRNLDLGQLAIDLDAKGDDRVKVVDSWSALSVGFPCPKAGDRNVMSDGRVGYEVVFVGQGGSLEWNGGVNGLYLTY